MMSNGAIKQLGAVLQAFGQVEGRLQAAGAEEQGRPGGAGAGAAPGQDRPVARPLRPTPSAAGRGCAPDCPACNGLGLVRYEVPPGDFRFGKLFPCPNLPAEALHQEGRYGLYLDEQRALSWESVLQVNGAEKALAAVQAVLARGHGWVYLWGNYGTAKTLLLKAAVAERLRAQGYAVYARMVDLLDDLRAAYDEDHANRAIMARLEHYTSLPLLALDEIDRVNQTDWARERIFQLLDRRYSAALVGRSVTLLAANTAPERLDGYLASRLCDGRFSVVHLEGFDLRPAMEQV